MPDLRVSRYVVIPAAELTWRFSRAGGPGGQSVNTTDSRVELRFDLHRSTALSEQLRQRALERLSDRLVDGMVVVVASEHRSQLRNREAALERLGTLLREATAPPPRKRRPTQPSNVAVARRLDTKRRRGEIKRARSRPSED